MLHQALKSFYIVQVLGECLVERVSGIKDAITKNMKCPFANLFHDAVGVSSEVDELRGEVERLKKELSELRSSTAKQATYS